MIDTPQPPSFIAAQDILEIADFIGDQAQAAEFPETILRFRNDRSAATIGLDALSDDQWIAHFGRFEPFAGSLPHPLALRYHGHQFRVYNPEIGDGRGFLFAQLRDRQGRLLDFGTKGSGQTRYSRFGDGRLTLKGAVREILATEMLEALGVETSKTFSVIETGEQLHRGDEPSPTRSAVLVRLSHGHIRIGSFQRLATLGETESLLRLTDYALAKYYGESAPPRDAPARLLGHVVAVTARLAARYMAAGFVHGVLNSDNINISGESFDYGPWRFAPRFDPEFTAAYFDESRLYAFGRQAEAIHWDVVQLAIALSSISDDEPLVAALDQFAPAYRAALVEAMLWRLGVISRGEADDQALVSALEAALITSEASPDQVFFDWRGGSLRVGAGTYDDPAFDGLRAALTDYQSAVSLDHRYWHGEAPCSLLIDEVEAIWAPIAEHDDWSRLSTKIDAIRIMGEALRG